MGQGAERGKCCGKFGRQALATEQRGNLAGRLQPLEDRLDVARPAAIERQSR
jgi:hypothetical protein